ncbi:MAG: YvcK family protein [Bacillota bacterium]|nr:MAG: YvcK family protein [Bacillota bacterium]
MSVLAGLRFWSRDPVGRKIHDWYLKKQLERGPRIVAIGGGTGLPVVLRGLKAYTANLTAVVTVADDGGSSGRLRGELGILPPGDIRNCLVALADTEPLMESLFQHRFERGAGLAGHSFGNLFIAAMTEVTGDFEAAVVESSRVLKVRGTVLPSTLENVVLEAELTDGEIVSGETAIALGAREKPIRRVRLRPSEPKALPAAVRAIEIADAVVLGPGSLYTSIIPNLLVPAIRRAVVRAAERGIPVALVMNVMTQPGETTGFGACDHLKVVRDVLGGGVNWVVVNSERIPFELKRKYEEDGAAVVSAPPGLLEREGVRVMRARLLDTDALRGSGGAGLARHDPERLAGAILKMIGRRVPAGAPRERKGGRLLDVSR